ncbi:MAG: hypothetical protein WC783_00270 [Candidatus Paceibacterota bacterium]|jgi:hypothetical protein
MSDLWEMPSREIDDYKKGTQLLIYGMHLAEWVRTRFLSYDEATLIMQIFRKEIRVFNGEHAFYATWDQHISYALHKAHKESLERHIEVIKEDKELRDDGSLANMFIMLELFRVWCL